MSYLLKALQKADRERQRTAPSTEQFLHDHSTTAERHAHGWRRVSVCALVIVALAALVVSYRWLTASTAATGAPVVVSPSSAVVAARASSAALPVQQPAEPMPALELTITGHLFVASGHSANKLLTAQGVLRVGEQLPNGWQLVDLDQRAAHFRRAGQALSVPLR
ncbi:hypothetical protein E3W66_09395 [Gammaproteobacteria bacterium LSUCC0057]|uniref:Uncharacterized protein n=1 Tax=Gammaproteobacteria bacterium LSUCC0057 TaxID=2559237 RepID=A0A4Y8UHE2_9GAMM|nr:hypothetical protein E3W66_09395 [Gammaproteobacteria bacterium LSUCC0057]